MNEKDAEEAVEALRQLGLKKYEAEVFVGLSRINVGTAKDISELTDVPRTRVYDSIRVLEADGLVEVQHSSPKKFRAVPVQVATDTLRDKYDEQIEKVESVLDEMDYVDITESPTQEVWSIAGSRTIENRTQKLIEEADNDIVLVIGHDSVLNDALLESLRLADEAGDVTVSVGTLTDEVRDRIDAEGFENVTTFESGIDWMHGDSLKDDVEIARLLLIDGSNILVSTMQSDKLEEHGVFGEGFGNSMVVVARRIISQGIPSGS